MMVKLQAETKYIKMIKIQAANKFLTVVKFQAENKFLTVVKFQAEDKFFNKEKFQFIGNIYPMQEMCQLDGTHWSPSSSLQSRFPLIQRHKRR